MNQSNLNTSGQRSRFGELIRQYRRARGLSQKSLAEHIVQVGMHRPEIAKLGTISERAISNLERRRARADDYVQPRGATVELLAAVFNLEPGTSAYDELLAAAELGNALLETPPGGSEESASFVAAGRERHLEQCAATIAEVVTGKPRALFAQADPGFGKTWLLEEVARRAVDTHPNLVVVWTECPSPAGAALSCEPVRQFLRSVTGDFDALSHRQRVSPLNMDRLARRVRDAVTVLAGDGEELIDRFVDARALFGRAETLGMANTPELDALRLDVQKPQTARAFSAGYAEQFAQYLMHYAQGGPLMWVIDDLERADEATCALIFHVMRRLRLFVDVPVLIAGAYRPAELASYSTSYGQRHPLIAVVNEAHLLMPDPVVDLSTAIGQESGRRFVEGLLDREPNRIGPGLRHLLFERTDGHPFFATELLHWFREEGAVVQDDDDAWVVADRSIPQEIPARVSTVIGKLLGRLTPDQRQVLSAAAIRGDVFALEFLARVLHRDPVDLAVLIETRLVEQHRLLTIDGAVTIAGKRLRRYRFVHALFREYLVDAMSESDRRRAHLATAEALRGLLGAGAHEGARELARHYELAGARRQAARACRDAGEFALNTGNIDEAMRLFTRARERYWPSDDPAVYGQALIGLANCARAQGQTELAHRYATEAFTFAERRNVPITRAYSLATLGMMDYDTGSTLPRAEERLTAAIALLTDLGDLDEAYRAGTLLGHVFYGLGKYDEALRQATLLIETAHHTGNSWLEAEAVVIAGNCELDLGHYERALESYPRSIELARATRNHRTVAIGLLNTGLCWLELGIRDRAISVLKDVLAMAATWNMVRTQAAAEYYLGLVEEGAGNWAIARRLFRSALEQRMSLGSDAQAIDCVSGLLRVAEMTDDRDQVRDLADELTAWHLESGITGLEHPARFYLAMIAAGPMTASGSVDVWIDTAADFLHERASRIADPDVRRAFLYDVPVHRRLIGMANARP